MAPRRVVVRWTETAKGCLTRLPRKVRAGLLAKGDELAACDDPASAYKPLTGPLRGYHRISYGRYRAIFTVEERKLAGGEVSVLVTVTFVAAGVRKEGDKRDIYNLAVKLMNLGVIPLK